MMLNRQQLSCSRSSSSTRTPFRPFAQSKQPAECQAHHQRAASLADLALPLCAAACISTAALLSPGASWAAGREKVAEFQASGFLFKDTVEVNAFDDPEIPGVTIYLSDFKRSLVDKLQKDFFAEPSQASLTCSISPTAQIVNEANLGGTEGKEVFSEKKGLSIFKDKTLRVRRVYDPTRRTVMYVAYSTRLSTATDDGTVSTGRYRTSICALRLPPVPAAPEVAAEPAAVVPAEMN